MGRKTLYSEQRKQQIISVVKELRSVSVNELSQRFSVTSATIRSDLTELEKSGQLIRTHGGAIVKTEIAHEQFLSERKNHEIKHKLAFAAIATINDGESLLLDTGTTTLAFAKVLADSHIKNLNVFTNDFEIAHILEANQNIDVTLIGGTVRSGFHYTYGTQAIRQLERFMFDKVILGTSALSLDHGLSTQHIETAEIKKCMCQVARMTVLLTDSSKLHQSSFAQFASLKNIDHLIIDSAITDFDRTRLTELVTTLTMVDA